MASAAATLPSGCYLILVLWLPPCTLTSFYLCTPCLLGISKLHTTTYRTSSSTPREVHSSLSCRCLLTRARCLRFMCCYCEVCWFCRKHTLQLEWFLERRTGILYDSSTAVMEVAAHHTSCTMRELSLRWLPYVKLSCIMFAPEWFVGCPGGPGLLPCCRGAAFVDRTVDIGVLSMTSSRSLCSSKMFCICRFNYHANSGVTGFHCSPENINRQKASSNTCLKV